MDVVWIAQRDEHCVVCFAGTGRASVVSCAASQLIDGLPRHNGEAHVVEARAVFVEWLTRVVRMLDEAHGQPTRVPHVDPWKPGGFVEPVTPDLEAQYIGIPLSARTTIRDRQVKVREPGQRSR